jgi:DNA-binding SARP family transcriptional activator
MTGSIDGDELSGQTSPDLRIRLLGGFHIERISAGRAAIGWQRRCAKTLTKLLATCPGHSLHREQIIEILWPSVDLGSALNSFGKALHAARRALEPELEPRRASAYLHLTDSMLVLQTEHVLIDADSFQQLAESALRSHDVGAYESALAAYGGELLPEDRFEDWCSERRQYLAELRIRILLGLAGLLEERGAYNESAERLREALDQDPTREDVHRRLMRMYAEMGSREQALRQFVICRRVLRRELELAPQQETLSLYQDVLSDRIQTRAPTSRSDADLVIRHQSADDEAIISRPFVGRESALQRLREQLNDANGRGAGIVLVSGEEGVGKTRLLEEFAGEASRDGAVVLWGGTGARSKHLAYGPLAVALEGYAASRSEAERNELAQCYPALSRFVPSLAVRSQLPPLTEDPREDHLQFLIAIARLLTALCRTQHVVLVIGDLHDADPVSLDVIRYLAHFAVQRRWLLIGAVREEELEAGTELGRMISSSVREGLCMKLDLPCLSRFACGRFVRKMLCGYPASDELLEHVYTQSRGNPLFVEELVREIRERRELVLIEGRWHRKSGVETRVPARVRAVVAAQLGSLNDTARRVLALAASALAQEIPLSELVTGAAELEPSIPIAALFDALDRAIRMRILEELDDGYRFRQPLVRSVLYDELSMHRRQQLRAALSRSHGSTPRRLRATG